MMGAFQRLLLTLLTIKYCSGLLSLKIEKLDDGSKAFYIEGGHYGKYSNFANGMRPRPSDEPLRIFFGNSMSLEMTYKGTNHATHRSEIKTRRFKFKDLIPGILGTKIVFDSYQKLGGDWRKVDDYKEYSLKKFGKMMNDPQTIIRYETRKGNKRVYHTIYKTLGDYFKAAEKQSHERKKIKTQSTLGSIDEVLEPSTEPVAILVNEPSKRPYLQISVGPKPIKMEIKGQMVRITRVGITKTWQLTNVEMKDNQRSTLSFHVVDENGASEERKLSLEAFRKILSDPRNPTVIRAGPQGLPPPQRRPPAVPNQIVRPVVPLQDIPKMSDVSIGDPIANGVQSNTQSGTYMATVVNEPSQRPYILITGGKKGPIKMGLNGQKVIISTVKNTETWQLLKFMHPSSYLSFRVVDENGANKGRVIPMKSFQRILSDKKNPPVIREAPLRPIEPPLHSVTYVANLVRESPQSYHLLITGGKKPIKMRINRPVTITRMGIARSWQLLKIMNEEGDFLRFRVVDENGANTELTMQMKDFQKILSDKKNPSVISKRSLPHSQRLSPSVPKLSVRPVVPRSQSGTYVATLVSKPPQSPYLMITGGQQPIKMKVNGQRMEMRRMGITNTWQLVNVKGSTLTFHIVGKKSSDTRTKRIPMERFRKILNDEHHPTVISLQRQRKLAVTRLTKEVQPPKVPNTLARQMDGDIYDGYNGQDLYAQGFEEGYRDALRQRMRGY